MPAAEHRFMKKHIFVFAAVSCVTFTVAQAADIGHYDGGILNIRDYFMPEQPGIYGAVYNYYYTTDRLNNGNGDKISSVNINTPSGPVKLGLDVDLNMYALFPTLIWVSPCEILGAKYGGYIAPSFANLSLDAKLTIADEVAGRIQDSSFAMGDLFVQPVWLDWGLEHWEFSLGYGFYAPVGRYNLQKATLPGGASFPLQSKNNIGLGFWTQQVQGGIAWYPMTNKATAVTSALTYEVQWEAGRSRTQARGNAHTQLGRQPVCAPVPEP